MSRESVHQITLVRNLYYITEKEEAKHTEMPWNMLLKRAPYTHTKVQSQN